MLSKLMNKDILQYNKSQKTGDKEICDLLLQEINRNFPEAESKVWHAHPVRILERGVWNFLFS